MASLTFRPYLDRDERSWLRCQLLSFLDTEHYDDVLVSRPAYDLPVVRLVATEGAEVLGLLGVTIDATTATIESVAVHPDHTRRGIADRLLCGALPALNSHGASTLDAWTRGDEAANRRYRAQGFTERHRYLHVYADAYAREAEVEGFTTPEGLSSPVYAFAHAPVEREAEMRARYRRVHVCRQYLRELPPT